MYLCTVVTKMCKDKVKQIQKMILFRDCGAYRENQRGNSEIGKANGWGWAEWGWGVDS